MGEPEDKWGISQGDFDKMPIQQRAKMEAEEQIKNWVNDDIYKEEWLGVYKPRVYDKIWWEEEEKLPKEEQYNLNSEGYKNIIDKAYNKYGPNKEE